MAQYQNGQYYQHAQHGHTQYQQDSYPHRPPSFMPGDDNPYGANAEEQYQNYGYPQSSPPGHSNSLAARRNSELFIDPSAGGQVVAPTHTIPPTPSGIYPLQSPSASQPTYNPQNYASQLSPSYPQPPAGLIRRPSFPNAAPGAYNPADYAESNLQRVASTAGYQHGFSPGYPSPSAASTPPIVSPSLYHQGAASPGYHSAYSSRPTIQTSYSAPSRPSHYTPPAPPPLPAIPGSAESPGDDWGQVPTRYTSTRQRYGDSHNLQPTSQTAAASSPIRHGSRGSRNGQGSHDQSSNSHSLPPTPGPPPPLHSTDAATLHYLQQRPLPQLPPEARTSDDYLGSPRSDEYGGGTTAEQEELEQQILNLTTHSPGPQADRRVNGDAYDESDAEAEAGLAAMREAERQDAEDAARRQSGALFGYRSSTISSGPPLHTQGEGSDSDIPIDLASFGGGFDARMSYGGDPNYLTVARNGSQSDAQSRSQPVSSTGSLRRSAGHMSESEGYEYMDSTHPFPVFTHARVDTFGTGGLADPSVSVRDRRLSYDEGDEAPFLDYSTMPPGDSGDTFYHHGSSASLASRPLPPPPPTELHHSYSSPGAQYQSEWNTSHHAHYPPPSAYTPSYYQQPSVTGPALPRHTSLVNHSSSPQTLAPTRAKTDAEERRRQQQRFSAIHHDDSSGNNTADASAVTLDLPSITKRLNPAKLSPRDFDKCREPWALSALVSWLRSVAEGEQFLKKSLLVDALVALFTYKVHTMNVSNAETLAAYLVDEMHDSGTLYDEEEWLLFSNQPMSGVVLQLTGMGCYAPKLHDYQMHGRCYSHLCHRTEKKIDLTNQPAISQDEDWATFYKLKKEDIESVPKKEQDRQNILHEIVQKEENYLRDLHVLISLYRDNLANASPGIIAQKKLHSFIWDVFGKAEAVKKANEEHLLPQMKYRQKEQGPWVVGFSDIFREWIRKAKPAYLEYASQFPQATYKMRQEKDRNVMFRQFLERCQADPQSKKLDWNHYLKVPITRLQQVLFLLENALQKSVQDNDEKRNLQLAIEEVKAVTHECDARVGDGQRKVDLSDLQNKLKLRPGIQRVELNLDHLGRQVIFQGEVLRIGGSGFTWLETHAILFDHYLVLAKVIQDKGPDGVTKFERYDVSRQPISMDLLVLESRDDDPVVRSLGGRAGVSKAAPSAAQQEQLRLARTVSNQSAPPGTLTHASTSSSTNTLNRAGSSQTVTPGVTILEGAKDDKTLYPFRIKHLGKETYTLYAHSLQNREEWCDKIIEAKTKHANALFTQNAEPFKLRVVADSAFAHEGPVTGQHSIVIKGTPLDRAIREVETKYENSGRPGPVCRAKVNCATAFNQPNGKQMVAVGTDFGVFVSEADNPRGWSRVITNQKVTQIAVLEDFSLFLLISEKTLIAYHLDVVLPAGGVQPANDSARKAPQKLSGSRDVGFFSTGRMKDRTLVFYKKRDGINSTFKVITVLEPVLAKATEKRSRFAPLRSGKTDFFRDFDEFYIPTECMGLHMFHTSLAVCTVKGFEVLTLDKKVPVSIPALDASHVQMIAARLQGQKPLGMFRLSEQEFLLVYEECAVYVNKHGDISRSVIMEFVGKARAAALHGPYVLLFDPDFVEIRNAQNGRLRQVIAGRDVKCLDDALVGGSAGARSVKLALQHPEVEKLQLVLELVLNEGQRE